MNPASTECPKCGVPVKPGASEGLCPRCLIAGVLAGSTPPAEAGEIDTTHIRAGFPRPFGDYELLGQIARGGMGVVYRARHIGRNRVVALKMLREGRLAGADAVRRFLLEAEAAGRLDHPHIIPVHEVGELSGRHFFTMRLVEGGSLADWTLDTQNWTLSIRPREGITTVEPPAYSVPRMAQLVVKIARAIQYAHERGILHRDLKPANILLDDRGEPLVSDFGLAKFTQTDSSSGLTLSGTVLGTPAYMAPEQATGASAQHTTAADIYSLGAILHHLLVGQPPLQGATALETLRRLVEEDPAPPSLRNPKVDRDLDTICLKCLAKNPAQRYATAAALADDLERWLRHESIEARQVPPWERAVKWMHRRPALTALLVVSTTATVAFILLRLDSEARLKRERDQVVLSERRAHAAAARAAGEARRAETNELSARLHLYAADILLAQRALDDGNLGLARRALQGQVPAAGQPDLRGFEWHYLRQLARGDAALVLTAHAKAATCLAFSRDGATLVTGGRDGRIRFWDAHTGVPGLVLPPPSLPERGEDPALMTGILSMSPDVLALVASGSDTVAGVTMRSRPTTLGELTRVALSPDGRWLASGSAGSFVRVWSLSNQQVRFVIATGSPRGLAFTTDSLRLVVGEGGGSKNEQDAPGRVKIYDLATHQRVRVFENVTGHFACSPDGRSLAVALPERWIEIHDTGSGAMLRRWLTDDAPGELAWSLDGRFIAAIGAARREIHLWSATTGERAGRFTIPVERVASMAFSPSGDVLAIIGADHAVRLWDVPRMVERRVLRGHGDELLAVAFSPTGDLVASCGKDGTARLWPVDAPAGESGWKEGRDPVAVSSDGRFVATRSTEGRVQLGDLQGHRLHPLPSASALNVLGFLGETGLLATVERPTSDSAPLLRHWNSSGEAAGDPISIPDVPPGRISTTTGAPAVRLGALAVGKGGIVVFDLVTGAIRQRLTWQRREMTWVQLSPDGRCLAAVNWPNRMRLWHLGADQPIADWVASEGVVQRLAFSADGGLLATAGDDNLITLWETTTGVRVTQLRGHKAEISALAFHPDGRTLASASLDHTMKLWHVPTWRELGTLRRDQLITFLAFAGDEPVLFAGEYRQALHLLRAPRLENPDGPGFP